MPVAIEQPNLSDNSVNELTKKLIADYKTDRRTQHLGATFLPNRQKTVDVLEMLRKLVFPGFFDDHKLACDSADHVQKLVSEIYSALCDQINQALRYTLNLSEEGSGDKCKECDKKAHEITQDFLSRIPEIRHKLALDVQATFDGDPAAASTDETIFCYPGIDAIFTHRIAHALHNLNVPLLPRILSEYAHYETGIDIHPAAVIGDSFCIDHGTGIVIGETTVIGDRVIIYQGVTLGALSTKGGQRWRGRKRHPTIENDVTIYGGAVILGGDTVIGEHAVIGGAVFLTSSIKPGHTVSLGKGELHITARKNFNH